MLGQVLDPSGRVEAEDEAVDVAVVATAMGLRVHRMLPHDVVAVREQDDVLVPDRRDVVGVDAGIDLARRGAARRSGQDAVDRVAPLVLGLAAGADEGQAVPPDGVFREELALVLAIGRIEQAVGHVDVALFFGRVMGHGHSFDAATRARWGAGASAPGRRAA